MIEQQFSKEPALYARLPGTLANQYAETEETTLASASFQRAIASAQSLGDTPLVSRLQCSHALVMTQTGQFVAARKLVEEAIAGLGDATQVNGGDRANCLQVRSRIKLDTGDAAGALPDAEQALAMLRAPRAGQRSLAIRSRNGLANVHARLGDYAKAIDAYEAAIAELAEMGRARTSVAGSMQNNFGVILINSGQLARASEALLKSRALSAGVYDAGGVNPIADTNLAGVWLELGRTEEAIELLEGALTFAKRQGNQRSIGFISSKAAIAWCAAGNVARCEERLNQGREALSKLLPPGHSTFGTMALTAARLALLKGDQENARQQLDAAVSIYDAAPERNPMKIVVLNTLAGLEQSEGNSARASELSEAAAAQARKYATGLNSSEWLGSALLARAKVLEAQKDRKGALLCVEEAKTQLESSLGFQAPATREALAVLTRLGVN